MMRLVQSENEDSMRAYELPAGVACYWQSGRLDRESLPNGLTREHRLKEGTWGVLTLRTGSIEFIWDDPEGGTVALSAPATMVIPPTVPHHVVIGGPFTLDIEFHRRP